MAALLSKERAALQREMAWWLAHAGEIHYAQIRPIPLASAKAHHLPITTDCSGAATCLYFVAGAPDPNSLDFNGAGWTGTLYANGEKITFKELEPGDMIVVGKGDASVHVYIVYRTANGGTELFSHGRESAPETVTLANAIASHGESNLYPRRYLPSSTEQKPAKWVVLNGRNERIGTTRHPARWAIAHPLSFRKFGQVKFYQR